MTRLAMTIRSGAACAALALAAPLFAQPSGYHYETSPGPRGVTRLLPDKGTSACGSGQRAYRFVLPPNGRAGAYFVPVKQSCDPKKQPRRAGSPSGDALDKDQTSSG